MNNDRKRHWNGKLDSFLQRTITSEVYERICTWEPCVITSSDEKLVHKYVLLTLNSIYLIDFNLKSSPKVAFSIKDVTSVKKFDGVPEFLDGKEREEAVHIQVYYNKKVIKAEKGGIENWLPSVDLSPKLLAKFRGKISSSKPVTSSGNCTGDRRTSSTDEETSPLNSPTSQPVFSRSKTRTTKSLSPCIAPAGVSSLVVSSKNRNVTFDTMSLKIEDQSLEESPILDSRMDSVSTQSLDVIKHMKRSTKRVEFADTRIRSRSANALNTTQLQLLSTSRSVDSPMSRSVTSVDSDISCGSEDLSVPKGGKSATILKPSTLDLYILRKETDFFYQMNSTWNSWKISTTLKQLSPANAKVHKSREQISQLFYQVKHELLATKKIEVLAQLFMELNIACRKHLIIKRLFWDSSELLELCLQQMMTHLHPQQSSKEHVSDVMEYCIIILELLYHVLQESFMCYRRLEVLFHHRGQLALSLLEILANSAQISATTAASGSNKEELSLSAELSEKVFCVLSELLRAVHQLKWYNNIGRQFSLATLVEFINSKEIKYKGLIVRQLVRHYSSLLKAPGELPPTSAVVFYHMIHVLHNLCLNSSKFVAFFRTELMDEIRHCLRLSVIGEKLPERYPITSTTTVLLKCLQDSLRSHSS